MPDINLNSQVLTNVALSANSLTVTGALSTSTYGNLAEQGIRQLRNFRRFRASGSANSGGASNLAGPNGFVLNAGNGATSYATGYWIPSFFTQTSNSGAGITFDASIGMGTVGFMQPGLFTAGFGFRFIIGDSNAGGVPANSKTLPLSDRGFGWSLIGDGTNAQYSIFAHTGTTYLSSTPVTYTGFNSLNRISQWWIKSNKTTNQIELYLSVPASDFTFMPILPATPTATLNATIAGTGAGRYVTANIITDGTNNPGSIVAGLFNVDEMMFSIGI